MFASTVAGQLFALLRNILVARILGPKEFGIAAVIILTIAFLDSLGNAGPQNLLVQAKDEDRRTLLAAAHSVTIGRGLSTTGLLLVAAAPLSAVFGLQLGWPAILGLAVSALVSGFLHQGMRMVQREGDFRPEAISQLGGELGAFVVAVAGAVATHSHIAIVFGLIARSVIMVALSHRLSPQPYQLNWDRAHLARFWSFGWPLLINGPLLFFSAQSDRLFISRELGLVVLGSYSAATVLINSPSSALMRWLGTNYVPSLAKFYHENDNLETRGAVYTFLAVSTMAGYLMFTGFAIFGSDAVHILYGSKYTKSAMIIGLIGLLQILRFLRTWPTTLSISVAASGGILVSTAIRLLSLPAGYAGLVLLGGLPGLLIGFIVGEAVSLGISHLIVNRNANRRWTDGLLTTGAFCALAAIMIVILKATGERLAPRVLLFLVAVGPGSLLLLMTISRDETLSRIRALIARRG